MIVSYVILSCRFFDFELKLFNSQVEQTGGAVAPTPEERHVANMQINGYENPTYKYFEVKE